MKTDDKMENATASMMVDMWGGYWVDLKVFSTDDWMVDVTDLLWAAMMVAMLAVMTVAM